MSQHSGISQTCSFGFICPDFEITDYIEKNEDIKHESPHLTMGKMQGLLLQVAYILGQKTNTNYMYLLRGCTPK